MKWNNIEKLILDNPDCDLETRYYVHKIVRYIKLNNYNHTRYKLTEPQFQKAWAFYFEDEPYVTARRPDGDLLVHHLYRRKK